MVPRLSSASWNLTEGALDQTIALLTQGESSARTRALLVEARRLRSRIASWRAIPPQPATRKEAFESAMHLLRKAGAEMPAAPPVGVPSTLPPPPLDRTEAEPRTYSPPSSGVTAVARLASSTPPARATSSAPPSGPPAPKREIISPGVTVVRPRSMEWSAFRILEGVDLKVLHRDDDGLFRALIRLAPGAEIPRHKHVRPEDIMILEGTLVTDGVTMRAGELCHAEIGSIHAVSLAPSGCTFLLVGSEKNEIFWD